MLVREPAVAGMFYRGGKDELKAEIESLFLSEGGPGSLPIINKEGERKITALVSPHAGLMYSGSIAAHAYHRLAQDGIPDTFVIIGPNHRSYLPSIALTDETAWRTPFGDAEINRELVQKLASKYQNAEIRPDSHYSEHSLEVQLPFIQYIAPNSRIVPIMIGSSLRSDLLDIRNFGENIAESLEGENAVIIASTDFTHYETSSSAQEKDSKAISVILDLDEIALIKVVEEYDITMCGVLPTAIAISASKALGANLAEKLAYRTSGDVNKDYSQVVGYAAMAIRKR